MKRWVRRGRRVGTRGTGGFVSREVSEEEEARFRLRMALVNVTAGDGRDGTAVNDDDGVDGFEVLPVVRDEMPLAVDGLSHSS